MIHECYPGVMKGFRSITTLVSSIENSNGYCPNARKKEIVTLPNFIKFSTEMVKLFFTFSTVLVKLSRGMTALFLSPASSSPWVVPSPERVGILYRGVVNAETGSRGGQPTSGELRTPPYTPT